MSSWKGKDMTGTFANGQGPVLGQTIKNESENKGLLNPSLSGRHPTETSGPTPSAPPSDSDGLFSMTGSNYRASGDVRPVNNEGEKNPFDIGHNT